MEDGHQRVSVAFTLWSFLGEACPWKETGGGGGRVVERAGGTIFRVTAGGVGRHNRRFCTGIHYAVFASSARLSSAFCNEGREALLLLARGGRHASVGRAGRGNPLGPVREGNKQCRNLRGEERCWAVREGEEA